MLDVFDGLGFTSTVCRCLLQFLDTSLEGEQREAALNDPLVSTEEQNAFIDRLPPSQLARALASTNRPGVLTWWAAAGTVKQRAIVAYNPAAPDFVVEVLLDDVAYVRMQLPFRPTSPEVWRRLLADPDPVVQDAMETAFSLHSRLDYPQQARDDARSGVHSLFF